MRQRALRPLRVQVAMQRVDDVLDPGELGIGSRFWSGSYRGKFTAKAKASSEGDCQKSPERYDGDRVEFGFVFHRF